MVDKQAVYADPKCWVTTIGNLISGYGAENQSENCELWIPPYQRGYAWGESNVKRLCKDLNNAITNGNADYHLGTLIFHKDEINDGNRTKNIWAIVDGQQRLMTIGILLGEVAFIHRRDGQCVSLQNVDMIKHILAGYGDRMQGILGFLRKCTVVCILVSDVAEAFQLFDTQNGRGKELSPVNLLKAYHFHEINRSSLYGNTLSDIRVRELESRWERSNAMTVLGGKRLLSQVLSEHLFRLRHWSRGNEASIPFTKKEMSEFQGLTLGCRENSLPLQNSAILRKLFREHYKSFGFSLDTVGGRLGIDRRDPEGMDPFMSICQAIINGEDFFDYAETYSIIYRELFYVFEKKEGEIKSVSLDDYELAEFRKFYITYCLSYNGYWRVGDIYARHVFESLCIFCFDRFGCKGLLEFHQQLYRLTYFDRVINRSLFYQSAGSSYAIKLVPLMLTSETITELSEAIQENIENMTNQCHNRIINMEPIFKFDNNINTNRNSLDPSRWQFVLGMENVKELENKEKIYHE